MTQQAQSHSQTQKQEPEGVLLKLGENLACEKNNHVFKYVTALEVECMKCPVGYPLGPGSQLKDGHIYLHGEFVI